MNNLFYLYKKSKNIKKYIKNKVEIDLNKNEIIYIIKDNKIYRSKNILTYREEYNWLQEIIKDFKLVNINEVYRKYNDNTEGIIEIIMEDIETKEEYIVELEVVYKDENKIIIAEYNNGIKFFKAEYKNITSDRYELEEFMSINKSYIGKVRNAIYSYMEIDGTITMLEIKCKYGREKEYKLNIYKIKEENISKNIDTINVKIKYNDIVYNIYVDKELDRKENTIDNYIYYIIGYINKNHIEDNKIIYSDFKYMLKFKYDWLEKENKNIIEKLKELYNAKNKEELYNKINKNIIYYTTKTKTINRLSIDIIDKLYMLDIENIDKYYIEI